MNRMRQTAGWLACLGCWVVVAVGPQASGQQVQTQDSAAPPQVYSVPLHQSRTIAPPWPVKRVAVTNPAIADVQVLSPRQVLVQGKAAGSTDLLMWSEQEQTQQARIDVDVDVERIGGDLQAVFPDSQLQVRQSGDVVVLSGQLRRAEQADQLHKYLAAQGIKYVDMTKVAGVQQVMLQVRIAEASRTAIRALGFNAFGTGDDFFGGITVGPAGGGPLNPISIGPLAGTEAGRTVPFNFTADVAVNPAVTLFGGFPDAVFQFFLQALAENQYLRILAEPNLVALSGEEASFLAGGEFPIPVVQGGVLGAASVTIEWKEFGVQLRFKPVVLGDGTIRLNVAPEVSDLSDQGAVVLQGFRVPSLVMRRAETTLELKNGQTFAMAGLIQRQNMARASRVPGAGDLPVLGSLFRSVRYQQGETEVVVFVRASLVEPLSVDAMPPGPGMSHTPPNDWELYGLAQLEGHAAKSIASSQAQWVRNLGLQRLKGPGAWDTYDAAPLEAQPAVPAAPADAPTEEQ